MLTEREMQDRVLKAGHISPKEHPFDWLAVRSANFTDLLEDENPHIRLSAILTVLYPHTKRRLQAYYSNRREVFEDKDKAVPGTGGKFYETEEQTHRRILNEVSGLNIEVRLGHFSDDEAKRYADALWEKGRSGRYEGGPREHEPMRNLDL